MQTILLSGGSGRRLWPLSNEARSKQFLPLLEKPGGGDESMVQRIVRQLIESGLGNSITVAINTTQADNIINQLGGEINVVTEPERRGTFPAISLAASYLKSEKNCPDDEPVLIMPCDAFVSEEYFQALGRMVQAVGDGYHGLVLLGITPVADPQMELDRFGYILPAGEAGVHGTCPVASFVEKPSEACARQLIADGAYWNGGVFACTLGYLLEQAGRYVVADCYEACRTDFGRFPSASFDCEVVEKAASACVVPLEGPWKDLGNWQSLTSELKRQVIGNAVLGSHCSGTHVINETQMPLYVDGLDDSVVVASPDGILVCAKKYSQEIKKNTAVLTRRPMYEERRWGTYRVLDDASYADGNHALTKTITLNAGKNISYQLHHHRSETWTFVEGEGVFVLDGQARKVKVGESVFVPTGHWHALKALTHLTFIEVQCGNPLVEEDIVRDYTFDFGNTDLL